MKKLIVDFKIKKEMKEEFIKAVLEVVYKTRQEEGCLEYSIYSENSNEMKFTFIETWESQEALDAHGASKHIKEYRKKMKSILDGQTQVRYLTEVE